MLKKLAGMAGDGTRAGNDIPELSAFTICKCGLYVWDDPTATQCPIQECGATRPGRKRMRIMVVANICERLRRMFANPVLAKYLAYAAERDPASCIYKGDVWDHHKELKQMTKEVYVVFFFFFFFFFFFLLKSRFITVLHDIGAVCENVLVVHR